MSVPSAPRDACSARMARLRADVSHSARIWNYWLGTGLLLRSAAETLDLTRPVAITMLGILNSVMDTDEAVSIVRRLLDALPSGGYLVISHPTTEVDGEAMTTALEYQGSAPMTLRTPADLAPGDGGGRDHGGHALRRRRQEAVTRMALSVESTGSRVYLTYVPDYCRPSDGARRRAGVGRKGTGPAPGLPHPTGGAMTQPGMTAMSKAMQDCVEACMSCHSMCEETMSSCMQMGGQAQMQIMRALMDCSEMTRMCADMMMRRSPMSAEMCAMCARACDMCAEACMAMPDDEQMMRCAEACRRCAESCRAMAGATM